MFQSSSEALKYIADNELAMVDLKLVGIAGQWLHVTIPACNFTQKHFDEGVGYDGSSGSGFSGVESGDMTALPDPETAFLDPFFEVPTISFLCKTVTADTKQPHPADPRTIAQRAVAHMRQLGIADEAWMGPEFEFHVFDRVEVVNDPYDTRVMVISEEVQTDGTTAPIGPGRGYFRIPPAEQLHDLRSEICLTLEGMGIPVKYHHHEVGASGQCEIEVDMQPLLRAADQAMIIKYVIKNITRQHGKIATFMPKPVFGEAGNGMHVHQCLTKGGAPLFYDKAEKNYANLSDLALQYTAGLLTHGRALTGLTNPSTNSFKRLVEGYEAPVNLFFSLANRSAAIRVPRYAIKPEDKRIEYRPPDFAANVYLALAAMLMAGLDGILKKIDPVSNDLGPFDVNMDKQPMEFRQKITPVGRSLGEALRSLRDDHEFLTAGEVFSTAFIEAWCRSKYNTEVREIAHRPHPYEYQLYLDV